MIGPLSDLVTARKSCRICMGSDTSEIRSGAEYPFDPNVVSHWSQWLGHEHPLILIVAQDFGDVSYFERHCGADESNNQTNNNLAALLAHAGLTTTRPPANDPRAQVYLTNLILCLKQPPMNRSIENKWVRACATNHLRPLVQRIAPPIIVGMGAHGWRGVRLALGLDAPSKITTAAGQKWKLDGGTEVFAVGHCGPLGIANRPWSKHLEDWAKIGVALRSCSN